MKAKKALKRLAKAETLLAGLQDQFSDGQAGLRSVLETAKLSLARARAAIDVQAVTDSPKKAPVKASQPKPDRLSAAGRKRISLAAKKRWAAARRKGINAVTGQRLSKTA